MKNAAYYEEKDALSAQPSDELLMNKIIEVYLLNSVKKLNSSGDEMKKRLGDEYLTFERDEERLLLLFKAHDSPVLNAWAHCWVEEKRSNAYTNQSKICSLLTFVALYLYH
jgi:hypothetical protein